MTPLAFLDIGFAELVVCGFVALLLFGGRLPEVMRNLGASYRSFKQGLEDLQKQARVSVRPPSLSSLYQPTPPKSAKPAKPPSPPTPTAPDASSASSSLPAATPAASSTPPSALRPEPPPNASAVPPAPRPPRRDLDDELPLV
jgi:TatA/E family protein of Tat protein translocase